MAKTIKMGNIYVEVPDESYLLDSDAKQNSDFIKPEEPEALLEEVRVYKPNDPFQSTVDRWEALGNLEKVDKPWIKKGYFIFFIVFPFILFQLMAVALFLGANSISNGIKGFLFINIIWLLLLMPALKVWGRANRKK